MWVCVYVWAGISDAQLRDENGRIHLMDMLSEEQRDLKMLQEFLLGDEEEEGMQRMRKFHWKDLGTHLSIYLSIHDDNNHMKITSYIFGKETEH